MIDVATPSLLYNFVAFLYTCSSVKLYYMMLVARAEEAKLDALEILEQGTLASQGPIDY